MDTPIPMEVEAERARCFQLVRIAQTYIRVSHQMTMDAIHLGWTPDEFISEIKKREALWTKEPKAANKEAPPQELLQITIASENR